MISPLASALATSVAWFSFFIVVQIAAMHATGTERFSRVILFTFAFCLAGCFLTLALLNGRMWDLHGLQMLLALLAAAGLMGCAFIMYMPLVFVIASSVTGDILTMLARRGGRMDRDDLHEHFVSAGALRLRLNNMRVNGLVAPVGEHYALTAKGERTARFFAAMKRFWRLGPGG